MSRLRWPATLLFGIVGISASRVSIAQEVWADDPAMRRAITVEAEGIALPEMCRQLGQAAGVGLAVRGDASAEKIILLAKDRPLGEILSSVAALFDFRWEALR